MKTNERTAVVLGATGLVGSELVRQLLDDSSYTRVVTLGRRDADLKHEKLEHHKVNFEQREEWAPLISGDVLFSAMGTTLKVAGSKDAQWRIDFDYQLWGMQAAHSNGVFAVVLVSSTGANDKSAMFYPRMKGRLDDEVLALGVRNTTIVRPSILDGARKEHRPAEEIGLKVARLLPKWEMLAALRPMPVSVVARAARQGANEGPGSRIWEAQEVFHRGAED